MVQNYHRNQWNFLSNIWPKETLDTEAQTYTDANLKHYAQWNPKVFPIILGHFFFFKLFSNTDSLEDWNYLEENQ